MSDFNFESFIAKAKPRVEDVTIYPLDLTAQITAAADAAEDAKGAEKKRLETERDELREQMEAAALTVKVRALTSAELLKVNGEDDEAAARALQISLACVEPAFTSEQAECIVQELPYTESSKILAKINELTFSEVKTPDFSPAS
ncbi:hypothetical protein [uncultured Dermacoccus sp.]|uniref:hypothetical protein n=1 Tax=uncultured Dermacoccus sp. TaxID=339343 RepID=UPI002593AE2A|nr:hypothetical protein [uncultured Dermacoccus sp.]